MERRRPCPECRNFHAGLVLDQRTAIAIRNCFLYRPNATVEHENKVFSDFERHCDQQLNQWKEERHFD